MTECIGRDSVYEVLTSLLNDIADDTEHSTEFANGFEQALRCVVDKVADIPTADVRPERHGEWVNMGGGEWGCSCCGHVISTEGSWEHPLSETQCNDYCRKCGAKMDGKDDK